jgi:hypothetical protein
MDPTAASEEVLQIAGIAGSLRQGPFNVGLLRAAVELAPGPSTLQSTICCRFPSTTVTSRLAASWRPSSPCERPCGRPTVC